MKHFVCQRCGECCKGESTVSLSDGEIQNIAQYLRISVDDFLKNFIVFKGSSRKEMKINNGYCIFFDQEKRLCKIHPVKPKKCKEWPFPPIIFKDKENFQIIQNFCQGLKNFSFEELNQTNYLKNEK
ncbi:MAG: YkgJ family cysteine cluster protein [Caldimicrobium sp.]